MVVYYGADSEQVPPIATKPGHTATKPDELPEGPVELAAPVAAAKSEVLNAPVLAVAADAVLVMFGIVPNPTAAIAVRATNNPIASFFISVTSNLI
jgi:hypothetical protein